MTVFIAQESRLQYIRHFNDVISIATKSGSDLRGQLQEILDLIEVTTNGARKKKSSS